MFEILATSAWLLESKYFAMVYPVLLDRLHAGQDLQPALVQVSKRRSERYGEDGLPQMFYILPAASSLETEAASGRSSSPSQTGQKVAIIPIQGTMLKNGGMCSLGTRDVIAMISQANQDPNVSSIVLDVDSPGGAVDGTEALGNAIRTSKKPIVAFADGLMASAAYWAGSQAKKIIINSASTGFVGSIGVLATHTDAQEFLAKVGQKVTILRSTKAVDKARINAVEPLTEELVAEYTKQLDAIHETFITAVKKGRGERLNVEANPFTGKVYTGAEGKKMGLVDAIGTLEDAVNEAHKLAQAGPSASAQASLEQIQEMAAGSSLTPQETAQEPLEATGTPSVNSILSNMKLSKLAALMGLATSAQVAENTAPVADQNAAPVADENAQVTEQNLEAAEAALDARDAQMAELEQSLATAVAERDAAQASLAEAQQELATLQAFRANQTQVDARGEDLSNEWDNEEEGGLSANELAAQKHLEEQRKIKAAKAKAAGK